MDNQEDFWMRLPRPKRAHPLEIYEAIIREHRGSEVRLGEYLMACGWTLGDAGWAAANWDLPTLAAAVANERVSRKIRVTTLSEAEVAKLKAEIEVAATKKATANLRPKRTTRIIRTTPRPPKKPDS